MAQLVQALGDVVVEDGFTLGVAVAVAGAFFGAAVERAVQEQARGHEDLNVLVPGQVVEEAHGDFRTQHLRHAPRLVCRNPAVGGRG